MKQSIFLLLILFLVALSCKKTPSGNHSDLLQTGADTFSSLITHDVVVKNPDSTDLWMAECLKDLKHEDLIDIIFEGIYDEKILAYDIFDDTKILPGKLKKMEEDGKVVRDQIGKFQFVEAWYLDKTNMTMTKRVIEIRLGTETFNSDGFLMGYEPLFKVILN